MLSRDSRYSDGPAVQIANSRTGEYTLTVLRKFPPSRFVTFTNYRWVDGDQLDQIAAVFLGDPSLWYRILDANPGLLDPTGLKPGDVIRIPNG
jgi:nucleoid-associated protein YgaU